ncbi:hypothetical protein [Herbaspirillum robiniae]|uniref:N-acetyltransferase domain-containing protein n=1 Tax=Herbaspirillum robiniae TaxID=2014887 RepID=A0ABX2M3P1_9BURK|nr:hypothetical protein [Herbaspirillum robiniae]NUU04583.1 hypothetical protein [Herbaspirillum robiniae]
MKLITATPEHIARLGDHMRPEDRKELELMCPYQDYRKTLQDQWDTSVIAEAILTDDGEVAGVWGVSLAEGLPDGCGSIWMLATPALGQVSHSFLRESQRAIGRAHFRFPALACTPWRENDLHLTWLKWCGFYVADYGHPHFLGCAHVWTPSNSHRNDGDDGSNSDRRSQPV